MKVMNINEMKNINAGWHKVNGKFNAYHCAACFLTAFGAGIARLCGYKKR